MFDLIKVDKENPLFNSGLQCTKCDFNYYFDNENIPQYDYLEQLAIIIGQQEKKSAKKRLFVIK